MANHPDSDTSIYDYRLGRFLTWRELKERFPDISVNLKDGTVGYRDQWRSFDYEEPRRDNGVYVTRSPADLPGRKQLEKVHNSSNAKDYWEESHCTKCFGKLTRNELGGGYDRKDHNCQNFCEPCLAPAVAHTELDYSDHTCGLSDEELWFSHQAKLAGYQAGEQEEYMTTKVGTFRTWDKVNIAMAVVGALLTGLFAMIFIATGAPLVLGMGVVSGAVAIPAAVGVTKNKTVKAKLIEVAAGDYANNYNQMVSSLNSRKALTSGK